MKKILISVIALTFAFPIFAKTLVKGKDSHPLFKFLCKLQPGALGLKAIKWNFTKFLINKKGEPIKRFSPANTKGLEPAIKQLL